MDNNKQKDMILMNFRISSFMISSVIVFGLLGELSLVYADEFSFDQEIPLVPDHGVRLTFESSVSLGSTITATVTSLDSSANPIETKVFTLYQEDDTFYRSDYINLIETGQSNSDELKVDNDGTIDVIINGQTFSNFDIISNSGEDVKLRQAGYGGKYNIGTLVDCSGSFYGGDTDGDGICDNWENQDLFATGDKGLHVTIEGSAETYDYVCDPNASGDPTSQNYDPLGTSVCPSHYKPDLYFEIDWMSGHSPNQDSLAEIVQAFSNSPYLVIGGNAVNDNIGFYKLDGNLLDSSGNGNTGTLNNGGTQTFVSGPAGQAFYFDGSTHIETFDTSFDFDTPFSLATWFNSTAPGDADVIFGKIIGGIGYQVFLKSDDQIRVKLKSASDNIMIDTSGISVRDSKWHHLAVTYDGSGNSSGVNVYIDGEPATLNIINPGPLTATIDNSEPLVLGNQFTAGIYYFTGEMFSAQIYDFELTSTQVNALLGGINMHFQLSDGELPHVDQVTSPGGGRSPGTDSLKLVWFGTDAERDTYDPSPPTPSDYWSNDARSEKAEVFHYVIFGHDRKGAVGTSGYAEMPGNDILITLGSWDYAVGTQDHQSGSLMHEIGHNLNLHHGGVDSFNCKPNYLSVMSYSRQTSDYVPGRPLDFSNYTLNDLNEPGPSMIGSYDGNELDTAHGDSSGNLWITLTGPQAEISGDFNHISLASCDGGGDTLTSLKDWDANTISLVARTHGNWVDGINILTNSNIGVVSVPNEQLCQNIPEQANPVSRSMLVRTCVDETFTFLNIKNLRAAYATQASSDITNFVAIGAEPEPRDPEYCLVQARNILDELENNPEISPAQGKEMLEDLMNKFDNVGKDDCDLPAEDKKRIFNTILYLYERYAAAVPEFETLAIIILSISIMTVIILTSRTKLSLSQLNK